MKQLLRNEKIQQELEANGFVVMEALSDSVLDKLSGAYNTTKSGDSSNCFFTTTLSEDTTYRRKVNGLISAILLPEIERIFVNYQIVNANFMVKPSGDERTTCQLHQDWTYVDEEKLLAINIWVPLVDLTPKNGAMHFVTGSHLFDKRVRGRNIYWPYFDVQQYMIVNLATPVYLKKGQPVVFIGKTFHYSPPNTSGSERIGASVVLVNKEAQLYNYFQKGENIYRAKVKADFFTEHGVNSTDFEKNLYPEFFAKADDYKREANHHVLANAAGRISF